jgi:hypothetical protein
MLEFPFSKKNTMLEIGQEHLIGHAPLTCVQPSLSVCMSKLYTARHYSHTQNTHSIHQACLMYGQSYLWHALISDCCGSDTMMMMMLIIFEIQRGGGIIYYLLSSFEVFFDLGHG